MNLTLDPVEVAKTFTLRAGPWSRHYMHTLSHWRRATHQRRSAATIYLTRCSIGNENHLSRAHGA
jgi:hypothetical protein